MAENLEKKINLRKIFNYHNLSESSIVDFNDKIALNSKYDNPISAAGCLFVINNGSCKKLLLIKYDDPRWPLLDDFGGQIDLTDPNVEGTIIREVNEETNGVINSSFMEHIFDSGQYVSFYNKKSKYYSIVIILENSELSWIKDTNIFGDKELADDIFRTISWYDFPDVKNKLAFRISTNPELMAYLES